ncbi:nitroreductase family deazaflavin-dependent oxidoreductase [Streptomyces sp. NPDC014685]|uniref:nitroreductase family deazaflavin-dependent oxidoreductase n=1 Tax=Streptomyces sp. NPDC014685 TaxID=3364881 RepID=UPI0036FAE56F
MNSRRTAEGRPRLPSGWRRRLARLPIGLYRVGLGPLFGKRLLLLHHKGRTSGLDRKVALEVVAHEHGSWTLAAGFGPKSAWYQNLRHTPRATIQFGRRYYAVTAHFLTAEEGGEIMVRHTSARPRTARRLCALMGFDVDGSEDSFRRVGRRIPFVRLDAAAGQRLP